MSQTLPWPPPPSPRFSSVSPPPSSRSRAFARRRAPGTPRSHAPMEARELAQTRRLCRERGNGFLIRELPKVVALLESLERRTASSHDNATAFEEALCGVIRVAEQPFVRERANEELHAEGRDAVVSLLRKIGELLRSEKEAVAIAATRALFAVARGGDHQRSEASASKSLSVPGIGLVKDDLRPSPKEFAQMALLRAGAVGSAVAQLIAEVRSMEALAGDHAAQARLVSKRGGQRAACPEGGETGREPSATDVGGDGDGDSDGFWDDDEIGDAVNGGAAPSGGLSGATAQARKRSVLVSSLLRLLRELSRKPELAMAIVGEGAVRPLMRCVQLQICDRGPSLASALGLLWNLCEASTAARRALGEAGALADLGDVLDVLWRTGYSARDKNLRNQVLIILSLIVGDDCEGCGEGRYGARDAPETEGVLPTIAGAPAFGPAGLVPLLLAYATAAEVGVLSRDEVDAIEADSPEAAGAARSALFLGELRPPGNYATICALDVEMRRLLWTLLGSLASAGGSILKAIGASPFTDMLLVYLEATVSDHAAAAAGKGGGMPAVVARLPTSELKQLQHCAVSVLLALAPRSPERFLAAGGHVITLSVVDKLCSNAQSATDSAQNERLLRLALMLVVAVVSECVEGAGDSLREELGELDAVRIMLATFTDEVAHSDLRADAVAILGWLCHGHSGNQDTLRRLGGIRALVSVLRGYVDRMGEAATKCAVGGNRTGYLSAASVAPDDAMVGSQLDAAHRAREDPVGSDPDLAATMPRASALPPSLLIRVIDTLWSAVCGNTQSEAAFVKYEGLDALLELLEVCAPLQLSQAMGLLASLVRNRRAAVLFRSWHSDRNHGISAVALVLRLFEDEEMRLACARPRGVLDNLERPLRGTGGTEERAKATVKVEPFSPGSDVHGNEEGGGSEAGSHLGGGRRHGARSLRGDTSKPEAVVVEGATQEEAGAAAQSSAAAFSRLAQALAAGDRQDPEKAIVQRVSTLDLRGKVAAVLEAVGFDGCAALLPERCSEQQTLIMAKHYVEFRAREAWLDVRAQLNARGVKPIHCDRAELERALRHGMDVALAARDDQAAHARAAEKHAAEAEAAFFAGILLQRDQEVRQLQLKKGSAAPKSFTRRKQARDALARMLADSAQPVLGEA